MNPGYVDRGRIQVPLAHDRMRKKASERN